MKYLLVCAALGLAQPVWAQEAAKPSLSIELNSTNQLEQSCRLSLLAMNRLEEDLERLVLEAVLFDSAGSVVQVTLFDLQSLPAGRPRVRQFDVPNLACEQISRLLINGVSTCTGADSEADVTAQSCMNALELGSKADIEVVG